ncbi:MAG: hypothetical protein JNL24_02755 [Bacteroidia bacterium]|nr:hypothetical protein [Bacteroidia bacterium]
MNNLTIILTLILTTWTSVSNAQTLGFNIIEVFWDKDTVETFDYTFIIVSDKDTIRPEIKERYFFNNLELTGQVSLIFTVRDQKVIVRNVDSYFLSGHSFTKLTVNPTAADTCINRFEMATCVIEVFVDENGNRIKPKDECEINHDITFRTFHKTGINNSNAFLIRWAYDKKLNLEWKKLQDKNVDDSTNDKIHIQGILYTVIERHENGSIQKVGQFGDDCVGNKNKKHGTFLTFDKDGNQLKKETYFYDNKRNKRILGLKHGWWGFYGRNDKYFLGIRSISVITDPCF